MIKREKLQKILANMGFGSRREVERWIKEGRIRINDTVAELGDRVHLRDKVEIDGRVVRLKSVEDHTTEVLLYHKPPNEICTRSDPEKRSTVFDRLPKVRGKRWISVGRLDLTTSGILLFTSNGVLASRLMHPSFQVEREYAVRLLGEVTPQIRERLLAGIDLKDGFAQFKSIREAGSKGVNRWYNVVICEGRNREVKRLFESQGLQVSRLIRVRFGFLKLPRNLSSGQWRKLAKDEVSRLLEMVKLKEKKAVRHSKKV